MSTQPPFSDAVRDENGNTIFCGRGPSRQPCPPKSYCNIAPNDAYAYCAKSKNSNTLHNDAIIDSGGNVIHCGPNGYCGNDGQVQWVCKITTNYPNGYCTASNTPVKSV